MNRTRAPLAVVCRRPQADRRGTTLAEVMVSILLISTILLISVNASATLLSSASLQHNSTRGVFLVSQMLDEVAALDFRDRANPTFGFEEDEDRADRTTFDDVDDYHQYSSQPPTHRDGSSIEGFDGWSIVVSVSPAEPDSSGVRRNVDQRSPLRVIDVVCTAPDGSTHRGTALVSDVPSDIPATTSYERWRRLQLDFSERSLSVAAPLRNHPQPVASP